MPLNSSRALRSLYRHAPRLQPVLREIYGFAVGRPPAHFTGWLMSTDHEHGWAGDERFEETLAALERFELTGRTAEDLAAFRWRHWIVAYAARHALAHSQIHSPAFAECGVEDGMTAYVALREGPARMFLYDAWSGMEAERLHESELDHVGRYSELSTDKTRRNLAEFADRLEFRPGYIPDSLTGTPPEGLVYLHIDLNSAGPTRDALDYFVPRMQRGGVVLFDDYGWRAYAETKRAVDDFVGQLPGTLLALPTGQALYFV